MSGRKQFDPIDALDAAVRVFWEKGYAAASVSDLLQATRLSRASLYATFGDKQHLFLACLARYTETVGNASGTALNDEAGDVRARIQAGFDAILNRMADPAVPGGCLLAQTAAESGALEEPIRAEIGRILDEQIRQMSLLLRANRPDLKDPESLAAYIVTVAQALAVMHRAGTNVDQLRNTAAHAMRALDAAGRAAEAVSPALGGRDPAAATASPCA